MSISHSRPTGIGRQIGAPRRRRPPAFVALVAVALSCAAQAQAQSPAAAPAGAVALVPGGIVAPGARLEIVFDRGFFLEGPAQAPDGRIFFSDITQSWRTGMTAGIVWVHDPATGGTTIFRSPSGMANGLIFDRAGRLIAAHGADFGGRYISRTDLASGRATILAGLYRGRPYNAPNDVDIDAKGRIYFTDPRYFGHEPIEQPVLGVYRIDPDGTTTLVLADVARPNGIAVSPDQKTLYVTEADYLIADRRIDPAVTIRNGDMKLLRYDLSPDGIPSNRRTLVDFGAEGGGGPDGIEVDRQGNIYAAVQTARHGIRVYAPDGAEIAFVPTPVAPTNLTLARVGGKIWMYIAAGKTLLRIETRIPPRD